MALEPARLHRTRPATAFICCWRATSLRCPTGCASSAPGSRYCPAFLPRCVSRWCPERVPRIHAETAIKTEHRRTDTDRPARRATARCIAGSGSSRPANLHRPTQRSTAVSATSDLAREKTPAGCQGVISAWGPPFTTPNSGSPLDSPLTRAEIRTRAQSELVRTREEMYEIAHVVLINQPGAPPVPPAPTADEQQTAIAAALELAYAQQPARDEGIRHRTPRFRGHDGLRPGATISSLSSANPLEIIPMPEFQRGRCIGLLRLTRPAGPGPEDLLRDLADSQRLDATSR